MEQEILTLSGKVKKGFGEGRYFIGLSQYNLQFTKYLGDNPYLGTLNLVVDAYEAKQFIENLEQMEIKGFVAKGKKFGDASFYPVMVNNNKAAIVKPVITRHPNNIIEIVSKYNLMEKLNLKWGDIVILTK